MSIRKKQRRGQLELRLELLRIMSYGERKPTRLMFGINTSWGAFQDIKKALLSVGLVEDIPREDGVSNRLYRKIGGIRLTEKGQTLVNYLDNNLELAQLLNWVSIDTDEGTER